MTKTEIEHACAAYLACVPAPTGPFRSPDDCRFTVFAAAFFASPIRELSLTGDPVTTYQERAEFFVSCVEGAGEDCAGVGRCLTPIAGELFGWMRYDVTCSGTVATFTRREQRFERDCARAHAACDASSQTGCTDRPLTCCPAWDAGRVRGHHCDGNVLLSCDDDDFLRYQDCSRLGGTCGPDDAGVPECSY